MVLHDRSEFVLVGNPATLSAGGHQLELQRMYAPQKCSTHLSLHINV